MDGAYSIRGTGIFQLDKTAFSPGTPGYRDWRGSLESAGQFRLGDQWVWGWDGTLLSDKSYLYDYSLISNLQSGNLLRSTPDTVVSQLYLAGRGDRSYFEARTMYFYGLSPSDDQSQLPVVHPVIDHEYTFKNPILGGEFRCGAISPAFPEARRTSRRL